MSFKSISHDIIRYVQNPCVRDCGHLVSQKGDGLCLRTLRDVGTISAVDQHLKHFND
jgi:hypothetical protein